MLAPKIEKHLQVCINCREEFELLNKELNEVDTYLSEKIITKEIIKDQSNLKGSISSWFNNNQIKYSFASAASIIFLFLLLYTASEISTPKSIIIASSINKLDFSTTRGRNSSSFVNAVNELENKNYTKAIDLLKEDISRSNNDVTLFYSYYILGITHIANAHSNFIGMFDDFDNNELEKAIMSFKNVLTLNNSGLFQNINYNSYYFLGQTYLLKGDIGKAKEYLTNAINYKSEYSSAANELLGTLE
ncbi:MAG: hypothetical protein KDC90_04105 [Ignavibacteriae bacterium]|nr:hypothetical protein [Ignavibacteriota bacterium]